MKSFQTIAVLIALLIVSVPVCFAEEINLVTDANGNLVYDSEFYREYNSLNQLVRIYNGSDSSAPLLQEFEFDPVEERIVKKVTFYPNGNPRETVIYFSQDFVRVDYHNGSVRDTEYVYLDGQLVAQVDDGETLFIHGNHEGSSSVLTDSNGNVVENTTYSPFGEVLAGGETSRFGYEAKEHDSVIGDTDFHFRKYQTEWGLFTQPDTLIQNVYDPQSLNRFSFERNNPIKTVDKDGHAWGYLVLGLIIAGGVGALQGGLSEYNRQLDEQGLIYDTDSIKREATRGAAIWTVGVIISVVVCTRGNACIDPTESVEILENSMLISEEISDQANEQVYHSNYQKSYEDREKEKAHTNIRQPNGEIKRWLYSTDERGVIIVNNEVPSGTYLGDNTWKGQGIPGKDTPNTNQNGEQRGVIRKNPMWFR